MPLIVNLRQLEHRNQALRGDLPLAELDLDTRDALIRAAQPLHYDLEVERLEDCLLVQGQLRLRLDCQCVRCLQSFVFELELDPWTQALPLEGEEAVPIKNDCVDLTPLMREDILLGFPQHPLCRPDCGGFKKASVGEALKTVGPDQSRPAAWVELNKLKL